LDQIDPDPDEEVDELEELEEPEPEPAAPALRSLSYSRRAFCCRRRVMFAGLFETGFPALWCQLLRGAVLGWGLRVTMGRERELACCARHSLDALCAQRRSSSTASWTQRAGTEDRHEADNRQFVPPSSLLTPSSPRGPAASAPTHGSSTVSWIVSPGAVPGRVRSRAGVSGTYRKQLTTGEVVAVGVGVHVRHCES